MAHPLPAARGVPRREDGEYGDLGYSRQLGDDEIERLEGPGKAAVEELRAAEEQQRDRWFAACASPGDADGAKACDAGHEDRDGDEDIDGGADRDPAAAPACAAPRLATP